MNPLTLGPSGAPLYLVLGMCLDADESHIFPSLALCAANWLQALGISSVVVCVFFFFKLPYSFLFTTYTPTNTEADDVHSGHILQDGSCCLWHVSGTFLFYPTFIPRALAMAPLMYNSFLPPLVA